MAKDKVTLARAGICPVCSKPMAPMREEDLAELLELTGGDAQLECNICCLEVYVGMGWSLEKFMDCFPQEELTEEEQAIFAPSPPVYVNDNMRQFAEFAARYRVK